MYGDFSRVLEAASGQYSSVLAQQGRFLLDAELNQQTAIMLDYLRRLITDLIGPFAGPVDHAGFAVSPQEDDDDVCNEVVLSPGHYYVYGLRCELPRPPEDAPVPPIWIGDHKPPFVVYLLVWEQTVGVLQAPDLVEPALGQGTLDTSRRSQVRWRPRARRELPGCEDLTSLDSHQIAEAFHDYNSDRSYRPLLAVRTSTGPATPGATSAPSVSGYSGVENQLYRVEIHDGGEARDATLKWSRDNGSVEIGIAELSELDAEGMRTATLRTLWRDARRGVEVGDWVELIDDHWSPVGSPPPLMRVHAVSAASRQITLEDTDSDRDFDITAHPLLRRWDQQPDGGQPARGIPVGQADGKWLDLEDGVQVCFERPEAHYQRGDYWLIPARTATGGILWPSSHGEPHKVGPNGPQRYLAPLALVTSLDAQPTDLRTLFDHLAELSPEQKTTIRPAFKQAIPAQPETAPISAPGVGFRLRSLSTEAPGEVFELYDGLTVGRAPDVGLRFDYTEISRRHAMFAVGEGVTVMDLGSTNGTTVNGRQLAPRVQTELSPGDTIEIGTDAVQFQLEQA